MDFYQLIGLLTSDIRRLEAKVVRLRYLLSGHLSEYDGKMLRSEIFSDLSGCYLEQSVYKRYISDYCDGNDPMDSEEHIRLMMKLSKGEEIVDL